MKAYKNRLDGRIIFKENLTEVDLGIEIKDTFICNKTKEKGEVIGLESYGFYVSFPKSVIYFKYDTYQHSITLIHLPPVKPDDIPDVPPGAIYCGEEDGADHPFYYFCPFIADWRERVNIGPPKKNYHYATKIGDDCHRAQKWFNEDQLPLTYPPHEDEWPSKPKLNGDYEWERMPMDGIAEIGDIALIVYERERKYVWEQRNTRTSYSNTVHFRKKLIDHTENGRYYLLKKGDRIKEGDQLLTDAKNWHNIIYIIGKTFNGIEIIRREVPNYKEIMSLKKEIRKCQEKLKELEK